EMMKSSDEPYMKERSYDIADIKYRIIRNLKKKKWKSKITKDVVVVLESLTPADTVLFSKASVNGYVTDFGGLTSHAAIIARSLNVPAVVGIHDATRLINEDDLLIIDGFHGDVIVNPTKKQLKYYEEKVKRLSEYNKQLSELKNEPAITKDGKEIILMSNLDVTEEIEYIIQNGSKGIGLVRTEQIFEEYEEFPDEDTQYKVYSDLAEKIYPEKVIIRSFDIGGDKVLPVDIKEANPFLGWRGIRFLLDNRELFKNQLKAILRASIHKNVSLMIPMISSIEEVRETKAILKECKKELKERGVGFNKDLEFGIMVEVPSVAVMAKEYAQEVDFFSIGTNDLIQYVLAVDRGNEIVSDQYQEFHPAIIRTLSFIIREGKLEDIFVSMCGEMAADPVAVPLLIGLGLDSLSVSASAIPAIKELIRSLYFKEVKNLAQECLTLKTEQEVSGLLHAFFMKKAKGLYGMDFLLQREINPIK
ncbi:MAG: phosphoenolpyruvate--protein phosphotransferase, partial [Bacteroidetes bacterium]|nr:phosphoenolpyruvate--protein phosphotransferase [Bacteroidota bacterium]